MSHPEILTLQTLTLDDKDVGCSLAVICRCHDDPDRPWQGILVCDSPLASEWMGRPLKLLGSMIDGITVRGFVTIDPLRLPSGDLRLHGAGPLSVKHPDG